MPKAFSHASTPESVRLQDFVLTSIVKSLSFLNIYTNKKHDPDKPCFSSLQWKTTTASSKSFTVSYIIKDYTRNADKTTRTQNS